MFGLDGDGGGGGGEIDKVRKGTNCLTKWKFKFYKIEIEIH